MKKAGLAKLAPGELQKILLHEQAIRDRYRMKFRQQLGGKEIIGANRRKMAKAQWSSVEATAKISAADRFGDRPLGKTTEC
jgi:hypothetical protein